jgi:hypothetical protein
MVSIIGFFCVWDNASIKRVPTCFTFLKIKLEILNEIYQNYLEDRNLVDYN